MAARCLRISVNYFLAIGEPTTNRMQNQACLNYAEVRRRKTEGQFYLKGFENFRFDE